MLKGDRMFSVRRSKSSKLQGERENRVQVISGHLSSLREPSSVTGGDPPPILSILIPALTSRPWERVWSELCRQVKFFNQDHGRERVEVLLESDNGEMTSGEKRHLLATRSRGNYRCFVDDDDEVTPTYVSCLVEGCLSGADVVTFNMKVVNAPIVGSATQRGRNILRTRGDELWRLGVYPHHRSAGMMTANHLCAWKKEIADQVAWDPLLGYGDDQLWYKPLYFSGLVKTDWHINRVLYRYLYNPESTANQKQERVNTAKDYVRRGLHVYQDQGGSLLIQTKKSDNNPSLNSRMVWVRDRMNTVTLADSSKLRVLGVITLD